MSDNTPSQNLIWMDLEMTGLDPDTDRILEVATLVTDSDLNLVAEGPVIYVKQQESLLEGMDEWNTRHHTSSGLLDLVREQGSQKQKQRSRPWSLLSSTWSHSSHRCVATVSVRIDAFSYATCLKLKSICITATWMYPR